MATTGTLVGSKHKSWVGSWKIGLGSRIQRDIQDAVSADF